MEKQVRLIRHARCPKTQQIKSPGQIISLPEAEIAKWEKAGFIEKQPKSVKKNDDPQP